MNAVIANKPAIWSCADAKAATGGKCSEAWSATGVSIDTRTLERGDLFVAIKGEALDGHDYLDQAFAKGAAACMVSRKDMRGMAGRPLHIVADTNKALNDLARAARARTRAYIVGITGSVGKTGTKEALRHALSASGRTYATEGNLNNQWGVPLSLARLPADTDYAVFELGMNHAGELTPLSKLVQPHIAVITTIAAAHKEFFPTVADIARAKAEIFLGMKGGCAVLNRDNEFFALLAAAAKRAGVERIVGFGGHPEADARLLMSMMEDTRSTVNADIVGERVNYIVGMPGHHWVINSLAVLAAVKLAGANVTRAAESLATLVPPKGRGARYRVKFGSGFIEIIDDAYNASPVSMRAAFDTLRLANPGPGGRRVAVLGDMRELGDEAPELHRALAAPLEEFEIDLVFTCGPNMKHLHDALPANMRGGHAGDSMSLLLPVQSALKPGDVVIVKGSLGSRMAPIVNALIGAAADPTKH